jgi:hypothetical protein
MRARAASWRITGMRRNAGRYSWRRGGLKANRTLIEMPWRRGFDCWREARRFLQEYLEGGQFCLRVLCIVGGPLLYCACRVLH